MKKLMLILALACAQASQMDAYCVTVQQDALDLTGAQAVDILVFATAEQFGYYMVPIGVLFGALQHGQTPQSLARQVLKKPAYIPGDEQAYVEGLINQILTNFASVNLNQLKDSVDVDKLKALVQKLPVYDPMKDDAIKETVHMGMVSHEHQGQETGQYSPLFLGTRKLYSGMTAGARECWSKDEIIDYFQKVKAGKVSLEVWSDLTKRGFPQDPNNVRELFFVAIDHNTRRILTARPMDISRDFVMKAVNTAEAGNVSYFDYVGGAPAQPDIIYSDPSKAGQPAKSALESMEEERAAQAAREAAAAK